MLTTDTPSINLGTLKYGEPHHFTYTIHNTDDKKVVITKVATGCTSCTKATMNKIMPARSSTTLNVVFTPGAVGEQNKAVTIIYDGGHRTLKLDFKALVNG